MMQNKHWLLNGRHWKKAIFEATWLKILKRPDGVIVWKFEPHNWASSKLDGSYIAQKMSANFLSLALTTKVYRNSKNRQKIRSGFLHRLGLTRME